MRSLAVLLVGLVLVSADAHAQRVAGRVVDASGAPVPGATVQLVAGEEAVRSTSADAHGQYLLRTPGPGSYRLVAMAVGFMRVDGGPYELRGDGAQVIDIEMKTSVSELPDVAVAAASEARDPLARTGFYDRRDRAVGRFIDRAEIEERQPGVLTDLFTVIPGFAAIQEEGDVRAALGSGQQGLTTRSGGVGCRPTLVVDDIVVRSYGGDRARPLSNNFQRGDLGDHRPRPPGAPGPYDAETTPAMEETRLTYNLDSTVRVDDVEAIEAYVRSNVPAQYGGTMSPCGAIVIWTRAYGARDL